MKDDPPNLGWHLLMPPQDAANRGALRSRAARLLNTGQLLCALVHIATLLPFMMSESCCACP